MFPQPRPHEPMFVTESIATQDDQFGQRLEGLVEIVLKDIQSGTVKRDSDLKKHPALASLETAIQKRFNMKVMLIVDSLPAAILPFYSNTSHVFLPDWIRGNLTIRDQAKLLKTFDKKSGEVNLQKATLGGIFSEYTHQVYMNFWLLAKTYELSAAEITACLLHELGHGFYACYYADRTDRTNQVLANIARHLTTEETGDVEYVYRELTKLSPSTKKEDVDKIVNGPRVVAGATWFKTYVGIVKSQTQHDLYNNTAFEQRADNFASRFGYAKALATGLDKLSAWSPEKSKAISAICQMVEATTTVVLGGLILGLIGTGSLGLALVFVAYKWLYLGLYREDWQDYTYDKLKFRYLRIRQDAVDQLKNLKLDNKITKDLLEQIDVLDEIIRNTGIYKSLPAYLANFLFSGARQAGKAIEDQQLMEALAANDLFVKAAEFRTLNA